MAEITMSELPPPHNYKYAPLENQTDEADLHYTRLLGVEERPLNALVDKLIGKESLIRQIPKQLPSPPPEDEDQPPPIDPEAEAFRRQKFREEILLRFSTLESSFIRIQLIQSSNQRERERYAAEKAKILETARAVKDNTVELRIQLEEAQRVLQLRKGYDELAGKILDDKKLKSRDDCRAEIASLEKEIEDLQQESAEYEGTWTARREQFNRVVAEGDAMVRLIKGIKDDPDAEHEQDEDMEDGEDGTKGEASAVGTPAPEGRTPMPEGGETPMPMTGEAGIGTPAMRSNKLLDVEDATRTNSRTGSPARHGNESQSGDVDMAEDAPPKSPNGLEASANQVIESAESVLETMDET